MQFQVFRIRAGSGGIRHAVLFAAAEALIAALLPPAPPPAVLPRRRGGRIARTAAETAAAAPTTDPATLRRRQQNDQLCHQIRAWCAGADAGDGLFIRQKGLLAVAVSEGPPPKATVLTLESRPTAVLVPLPQDDAGAAGEDYFDVVEERDEEVAEDDEDAAAV